MNTLEKWLELGSGRGLMVGITSAGEREVMGCIWKEEGPVPATGGYSAPALTGALAALDDALASEAAALLAAQKGDGD